MSESIINYSFIGRLIRCYRIKMGITQKELLSATGNVCSLRTLSRIENGEEAKNKTKYTALVKYLNKEFDPQSFIWYEIQDYKKRLIYYINNEVELKKYEQFLQLLKIERQKHSHALCYSELLSIYIGYIEYFYTITSMIR